MSPRALSCSPPRAPRAGLVLVDRHGVAEDRVDVAPRRFHVGQQPLERGLLPLPVPWLAQIAQRSGPERRSRRPARDLTRARPGRVTFWKYPRSSLALSRGGVGDHALRRARWRKTTSAVEWFTP